MSGETEVSEISEEQAVGADRTQEIEARAREMGWSPKEEFKGDPEKWVDAASYVEHGEQVLPIVRATNKRLKDQLDLEAQQRARLQAELAETREGVQALQEHHAEQMKTRLAAQRKSLLSEIANANKDGEHERAAELTGELTELDANAAAAKAAAEAKAAASKGNGSGGNGGAQLAPEVIAWQKKNEWYGTDRTRTSIAQGIALQLRAEQPDLKGVEFLNKVSEETMKEIAKLSGGRPRTESKVEAGRGGSGGDTGGNTSDGKSYADLPGEAKRECDRQGADARLVGPTKLYKNLAEWRKYYAKTYFEE